MAQDQVIEEKDSGRGEMWEKVEDMKEGVRWVASDQMAGDKGLMVRRSAGLERHRAVGGERTQGW